MSCMEGPSLVILKEEMAPFIGKKVIDVGGNNKGHPKITIDNLPAKKLSELVKECPMSPFGDSSGEGQILAYCLYKI